MPQTSTNLTIFFLEISARQTFLLVFVSLRPILLPHLFAIHNIPSKSPFPSHMSRRNKLQNLYPRTIHLPSTQANVLIHPLSRKTLHLTSQHPPRTIHCISQTSHIHSQTLHRTNSHHYQAYLDRHSDSFL